MNGSDTLRFTGAPGQQSPDGDRWARLDVLFEGALDRDPASRSEWLDHACGNDSQLRMEVEAMLSAHEAGAGILDRQVPLDIMDAIPTLRGDLEFENPVCAAFAAAIADRYVLERELGRGGMSTVFLAQERKHDRPVVLKVLEPALAAIYGMDRFEREVRIAARLSHPHIVPLLDSGEEAGLLYYVMPHIRGETLRDRMVERGVLPFSEALTLLCDIAEGLEYAHDAGVVHRDLKPENVLCAGEHAYLLDFGVAKLLSTGRGSGALTRDGATVGTPAYMAPEQRHGDPEIDHRADVYAWGLLAHELFTGRLPSMVVAGDQPSQPALPARVAGIVRRCLADDPDDRPQHMSEVLSALRQLNTPAAGSMGVARSRRPRLVAMLCVALLATLVSVPIVKNAMGNSPAAPVLAEGIVAPLAVAPLSNQTGDAGLESWGRMAADWITQGLQEAAVAPVIPWSSVLSAATRGEDGADVVRLLQHETGAGTVVSGSYYLQGDSMSVRVEVVDAATGRALSAPPPVVVPRDSASAATRLLRDRVMSVVAIVADGRLTQVPGLDRNPPTFEAYRAFDQGMRQFLAQEYAGSLPHFLEARRLDSNFALAHLYAASAALNVNELALADSLANGLLADTASLTDYHGAWAEQISALIAGDYDRSREAARRASLLAPGSRASYTLAQLALSTNRPHEAIEALDQLDPDRGDMRGWSSYWTQRAHALHLLGRYEEELVAARSLRSRFPQRYVAWVLEARALGALGRVAELDSLIRAADVLPRDEYWSQAGVMVVGAEALRAHYDSPEAYRLFEQAAEWLEYQLQLAPGDRSHSYWLGNAYMQLGRWNDALGVLRELSRAYPDRLQYRGLAAVAAAHAGASNPESLLGAPVARERGEYTMWRARLASAKGDREAAARDFGEAVAAGMSGLTWLHESASQELKPLWEDGVPLPAALSRPQPPVGPPQPPGPD